MISIIEGRRKEAEGSINIGKCQDSRRRPIYTTIVGGKGKSARAYFRYSGYISREE